MPKDNVMLNLLCAKPEAITSRFSAVMNMHAYCVLCRLSTPCQRCIHPPSFSVRFFFLLFGYHIKFIMKCVCVCFSTGTHASAQSDAHVNEHISCIHNEWRFEQNNMPSLECLMWRHGDFHGNWRHILHSNVYWCRWCRWPIARTTFAKLVDPNLNFWNSTWEHTYILCSAKKNSFELNNRIDFVYIFLSGEIPQRI